MKRYIKSSTEKPTLDYVTTEWEEFDDGSGIRFTIYSEDNEVLFEEVFDYDDVDSDAIYDSAIDMAILALSQKYDISNEAIQMIKGGERV
jgi:hypothetical protein